MDNKKNDLQYLQLIPHCIFFSYYFSFTAKLYGGLAGVLFDNEREYMPLDVTVIFYFF